MLTLASRPEMSSEKDTTLDLLSSFLKSYAFSRKYSIAVFLRGDSGSVGFMPTNHNSKDQSKATFSRKNGEPNFFNPAKSLT